MLKAVIFYLNNGTDLKQIHSLFLSLQHNSIRILIMDVNSLTSDTLSSAFQRYSLSPPDCVLITDCPKRAKEAGILGLTCIGIMPSATIEGFMTGANCIIDSMHQLDYKSILEEYNHSHNLPSVITTTSRCVIKELTTEEIPAMYALYQDKTHVRYLPLLGSLTEEIEKHKAYIAHVYNLYRFGLWGVFLKDEERLIGRCGLQCVDLGKTTEVELAYLIDASYTKQGFGYEVTNAILQYARDSLSLTTIIARIHKDNLPSIALARKLGFHREGAISSEEQWIYRIDFSL